MRYEQQQIAIAKACGRVQRPDGLWFPEGKNYGSQGIPNYLNDLNAMHKAEKTLDANQCAEYARQLMAHHPTYCVTVLDNRFAPTEEIAYQTYQLLHTTASQRAEAFLRTIGKWEECK